jgi:hypothetical protein
MICGTVDLGVSLPTDKAIFDPFVVQVLQPATELE